MSQDHDWHSMQPEFVPMSLEDAHGGDLLRALNEAQGAGFSIAGQISSISPPMAMTLQSLVVQYDQVFKRIELELRTLTRRPEKELAQLELLDELRGNNSQAYDKMLQVSYRKNDVVYWIHQGAYRSQLPNRTYVTRLGQASVTHWTIERTETGIRLIEYLDKGEQTVVTETGQVPLEPYSVTEQYFAKMLLKVRQMDTNDRVPLWVDDARVALTAVDIPIGGRVGVRRLESVADTRVIRRIEVPYTTYPFSILGSVQSSDPVKDPDYVKCAWTFLTKDVRYMIVLYETRLNDGDLRKLMVYDLATEKTVEYEMETELSECIAYAELPTYVPTPSDYVKTVELVQFRAEHPYCSRALSFDEIPRDIPERMQIHACREVIFEKPILIQGKSLHHASTCYAYVIENSDGTISVKVHWNLTVVDGSLNLAELIKPSYY